MFHNTHTRTITKPKPKSELSDKIRAVIKDETFQTYMLACAVGIAIGLSIVL